MSRTKDIYAISFYLILQHKYITSYTICQGFFEKKKIKIYVKSIEFFITNVYNIYQEKNIGGMKTNREYKNRRMMNNIEDLCTILTDPNRDVNDFVQQARGALRFYKLLIGVNEEVGDMTDLRCK